MKFSTLTEAQQEIFEIVAAHNQINGKAPSLRDIQRKATTVKSLRGVTLQLDALKKAGFITRSSKAKTIIVNDAFLSSNDNLIEVPLYLGTVPAGTPSLFEEYTDEKVKVKLSATKGLWNVFAFKVKGDSMLDDGIEDGDYALISPKVTANDGDIVLALLDDGITLKRYRIVDTHPILVPANKKYRPIIGEFTVQGKLINIVKHKMMDYFQQLTLLVDKNSRR